ncbi:hypothetical protein Pcinc_036506 [Petrolisthes cinctipes]|uniref:Uncharacterized protein n=1 Tax=Petrolisthes cinctipes TaxID=88211 RepID=A0AAE1BVI4_PETCI|nr:hypothetical protein Pcinc_036506 [Petrolisthes cinctipes]
MNNEPFSILPSLNQATNETTPLTCLPHLASLQRSEPTRVLDPLHNTYTLNDPLTPSPSIDHLDTLTTTTLTPLPSTTLTPLLPRLG